MKNETNYKITGKRFKLSLLKNNALFFINTLLPQQNRWIPISYYKKFRRIKNSSKTCNTLGLKYHQQ